MSAKYFSIIQNYVLSVSLQRKYNFYHQNTLLNAFRTNSRNVIGRNLSMVIPLLANQDLKLMVPNIQYNSLGRMEIYHHDEAYNPVYTQGRLRCGAGGAAASSAIFHLSAGGQNCP